MQASGSVQVKGGQRFSAEYAKNLQIKNRVRSRCCKSPLGCSTSLNVENSTIECGRTVGFHCGWSKTVENSVKTVESWRI